MKIRIKQVPQALSGLSVEDGQSTPISDNMEMLGGKSHAEGGTMIQYAGKQVEAERGEPVSIGENGEAVIWGNMNVPGSKKKFKSVAKELGEEENRYSNLYNKGAKLTADNSLENKYQRLAFNSGKIMMMGAAQGNKEVTGKKDSLAKLQKEMLQHAEQHNLDPQAMSQGKFKKAKKGAFIAAAGDNEDPSNPPISGTVSDRHNNPGNIKWGEWARKHGATKGEYSNVDKDYFARFPTIEAGQKAMRNLILSKNYKDLTPDEAINRWTNKKPYHYRLSPDIAGKKISQLSKDQLNSLLSTMTQGEGTKYGGPSESRANTPVTSKKDIVPPDVPNTYNYTAKNLPDIPIHQPIGDYTPLGPGLPSMNVFNSIKNHAEPPQVSDFQPVGPRNLPTNAQNLKLTQILPEIAAFAQNKQEPVALQKYTPQLYVPYQMSFQDRLNDNQRTFNQLERQGRNHGAAAASALGMSKYNADNSVRAEEFRTNQGIQADTINKNVAINNDAQLKNLQLADTQYTRQAEAKARTQEITHMILNSIAGKYQQNDLQNQKLKTFENLYDYRFTPNKQGGLNATYEGGPAYINPSGNPQARQQGDGASTVVRNPDGTVRYTRETYPNPADEQGRNLTNQQKERDLSMLSGYYDWWSQQPGK